MNLKTKLTGVFPPCVTVFNHEQRLDSAGIRENIEWYNGTGIRGFMPLGSNGEFRSLTDDESVEVISLYTEHRSADKVIIAGAGRESLAASLDFITQLAEAGVDFASILPPHYYAAAMNEDALYTYYSSLADHSPLPILLYNIPKFSAGITLTPALVSRLAPHPNIAGIKDSSSEPIDSYCRAVPQDADFFVLAGSIKKFFAGLSAGAVGGVLSIADYLPELCCEIHQLFINGKTREAQEKEHFANTLSAESAGRRGVPGVKAAMDILGRRGGDPRLPLLPLSAEEKQSMAARFEKEGLR